MKLQIATPLAIVVDEDAISALRAEDQSGSFGILPGHADFITSLAISVVSWRKGADGPERYCAVRRGVLSVAAGRTIAIASREAIAGDDLASLRETVLGRFRADLETQRMAHVDAMRLQLTAIRQIMSHLRPDGQVRLGAFG